MSEEILRMENISKIYSNGFVANHKIHFSLQAREIHALMGENGAGKSTLMKVLFGLEQAQSGQIVLHGKKVEISSPKLAMQNGICMVHQHFMLIPSFSVAENMVLGLEPLKYGLLDLKKATELSETISERYNLQIDPLAKVENLTVAQKQKVEILKALLRGAEILILDEPTAVLTPQETEELFVQLETLRANGHTLVFISHKLNEIKQICDRITILRNGRYIATVQQAQTSKEEISRLMVGRDVALELEKTAAAAKGTCLEVSDLSYNKGSKTVLHNIQFNVRYGEILGIAGVEGNGQEQLVNLLTGMQKLRTGHIQIDTQEIQHLTIRGLRRLGLSHIPEDRMEHGVALQASVEENLISDRYYRAKYNKYFILKSRLIREECQDLVQLYDIKLSSMQQSLENLSGGNMQKVVIARELSAKPGLLVADQPSRGVDVGSAEFIYRKIIEIRDAGTAVLLLSSDLNEILQLSDRLIVMHNGEIVAHFHNVTEISDSEIGQYMLGLKKQSAEQICGAVAV